MVHTHSQKEYFLRFFFIIFSAIIGLALIEVFLMVLHNERFFVWTPDSETIFTPTPGVMPGISNNSVFSVNSEGMRGDKYSLDYDYKILTVGGSTTECLYLDQSESWPYILQSILRDRLRQNVFVGNVGKSGNNTREHYYQTKYLLNQYLDIDMVVLLIGINDLHLHLSDPAYSPFDFNDPVLKEKVIRRAFAIQPLYQRDDSLPFYKQTNVWKLLRDAKDRLVVTDNDRDTIQDNVGYWYDDVRKYRADAKHIIEKLPDIREGLEEYRKNINKIIDITVRNDVKLLILTQPVMWDMENSNNYKELLWLGGIGDFMNGKSDTYYSMQVLAEAMEKYNEELLLICDERKIECIDLAAMLPKDTNTFYDDVHFNESGAKSVASIVAQHLENNTLIVK